MSGALPQLTVRTRPSAWRLPSAAWAACLGLWLSGLCACSDPGDSHEAPGAGGRTQEPELAGSFGFDDITEAAGLDLQLGAGGDALHKTSILEVNGSGAALVDLDADGLLDIVFIQGNTHEGLVAGSSVSHPVFVNRGQREGVPRFEPVEGAGLSMQGWPTGVCSGDVDRDGRPDLVIGGHGEDALFLNRTEPGGGIRFEKHALPGRSSPLDWTTSLALADADGDGLLDLYLVRYLELDPTRIPDGDVRGVPCRFEGHSVLCGPHGLDAQPDVFLGGLDAAPWFEDRTRAAGLADIPPAYGLGLLFMDLDQDGRCDVYVANDSVDNFLLRNTGNGTFENASRMSGAVSDRAGRPQAGMGVNAADWDRDGDFDLVVTNFSSESNTLYRAEGGLRFRDVSTNLGLSAASRPLLGWGVHLADFDADGFDDVFFSNGHVYPEADRDGTSSSYAQPLIMLRGEAEGRFSGNEFPDLTRHRGRAALRADIDNDGDLDLLVVRLDDSPRLFLNTLHAPGRQLLVTLEGDQGIGPDAFGSTLLVQTSLHTSAYQKRSASSFQSQDDSRLHVVLPPGSDFLTARVLWLGGDQEELDPERLFGGQHVTVQKGMGIVRSTPLNETEP